MKEKENTVKIKSWSQLERLLLNCDDIEIIGVTFEGFRLDSILFVKHESEEKMDVDEEKFVDGKYNIVKVVCPKCLHNIKISEIIIGQFGEEKCPNCKRVMIDWNNALLNSESGRIL